MIISIGKIATVFLFANMILFSAMSQYTDDNTRWQWSTGIAAGGMNCLTDLGGTSGAGKSFIKDLNYTNTKPCISFSAQAIYDHRFSLRFQVLAGSLTAYDSILGADDHSVARQRYNRNLHFRTAIAEATIMAQYFLGRLGIGSLKAARLKSDLTVEEGGKIVEPYLAAGAGFYHFNPRALIGGGWVSLREWRTEGQGFKEYPQRKPYVLFQLNLPLGAGIRYHFSPLMQACMEIGYRVLLTDYLDDTSAGYADPGAYYRNLPADKASMALGIADRRRDRSPALTAEQSRGDPSDRDAYFMFTVGMTVSW
ncbi:MAG: hypothetical protein ABI687_12925 [Flavitalea sp.]